MPVKLTVVAVLIGALALAACGNPPARDVSAAGKKKATPTQAVQEIDIIRKNLLEVTNDVRRNNRKDALQVASDTYVQHVEKIEPVLQKISPKLKQTIEKQFAGTLRQKLRSKASKKEIYSFVTQLDRRFGIAQVQIKNLH